MISLERLRFILLGHKWRYRNPYDRTCSICGRNEVAHTTMLEHNLMSSRYWWEVFNEGDKNKHIDNLRGSDD